MDMVEAWIQILCPECEEPWEENPNDLPSPDAKFSCDHCGVTRPTAEFMRTARDLEILENLHSS